MAVVVLRYWMTSRPMKSPALSLTVSGENGCTERGDRWPKPDASAL
jgi:hypothetical protein